MHRYKVIIDIFLSQWIWFIFASIIYHYSHFKDSAVESSFSLFDSYFSDLKSVLKAFHN